MPVYDYGGGGGLANTTEESDTLALDKLYDLYGEPSAEMMSRIDEMFSQVFAALRRFNTTLAELAERISDLEDDTTAGELQTASTTLNHTNILALQSTHVTMVSAVTGSTHVPVLVTYTKPVFVSGYVSNMSIDIVWSGDGAETLIIGGTCGMTATAASFTLRVPVAQHFASFTAQQNSALDISSTTANSGGDAGNTLAMSVWYVTLAN